jgi:hypothetical protein
MYWLHAGRQVIEVQKGFYSMKRGQQAGTTDPFVIE